MKAVLALVLAIVAVAVVARPEEKYTTQYDDIDLDAILTNERLLKQHHECLMDRSTKCTKEIVELKKVIADALENYCSACSEKQKAGVRKVLRFIYEKHREQFDELKAKYDPEGKYIDKYREEIKKEGITV